MKILVSLSLLFALGIAVGCSSAPLEPNLAACGEMDWYELGRSDGFRGQPNLQWQERAKFCKDFNDLHHRAYINGWYAGINEFCTPQHAFVFGRSGQAYYDVCGSDRESEFLAAYRDGQRIYQLEQANKEINRKIRALEVELTAPGEVASEALVAQLQALKKEKANNSERIWLIEKSMGREVL